MINKTIIIYKTLSCGFLKVSSQVADVWNHRSWVLVSYSCLTTTHWNSIFFWIGILGMNHDFQGDQANLPVVTSLRGFAFKVPLEESHKPSLTWATHIDSDDISWWHVVSYVCNKYLCYDIYYDITYNHVYPDHGRVTMHKFIHV